MEERRFVLNVSKAGRSPNEEITRILQPIGLGFLVYAIRDLGFRYLMLPLRLEHEVVQQAAVLLKLDFVQPC